MLKQLRLHLTLISSFITGAILCIICLMALKISEQQLSNLNHLAFESHLNTIAYQLQHHQVIKNSWLAQLEADNSLIIAIQDNGTPFLFKGAWVPVTARDQLIDEARSVGLTLYQFDLAEEAPSMLNISKVFFKIQGTDGEYYRVALAIIPSQKGTYTLTLLQDMSGETSAIIDTRFLFIFISLLGISLLGVFSYWFSGRAIQPIEFAQLKQKEFIAAASHELKTPLAVIQSNSSALQTTTHEMNTRFLTNIQTECSRLAKLVDDLLLLATADAKTWSIASAPVELDTLLINLLDSFLPLAHKKKQHLQLILPDDLLPAVLGDQERLTQAISILLDNALYYVPIGGKITIQLHSDSHATLIQVIDNGPGIPPEHQPHIFDRFYRVDTSHKDKNHYGLGLSIAQDIIHLHQGTLSLRDTPGGGCTFIINLPN